LDLLNSGKDRERGDFRVAVRFKGDVNRPCKSVKLFDKSGIQGI
jgi:hypothetical protein